MRSLMPNGIQTKREEIKSVPFVFENVHIDAEHPTQALSPSFRQSRLDHTFRRPV